MTFLIALFGVGVVFISLSNFKDITVEHYPKLYEALGKNLIVEDIDTEIVKRHLQDLSDIPLQALRELKKSGYRIMVANKPVSGFPGMTGTADIHPPGWGKGTTFQDLAGIFVRDTGTVYLGSGEWDIANLAIHEVAHAVDDNWRISESPEMQAYYRQYQGTDGTYQTDPEMANAVEEFFAGSSMQIFTGQAQTYDNDYVDFVNEIFNRKSDW